MSIREITECDECGAVKLESNHWFCLLIGEPVTQLAEWNPACVFALVRMADLPKLCVSGLRHLCSQRCATAVFSRWMDTRFVEKAR